MYSGVLEPDKVTFCRSEPNSKFSITLIKVKLPLFKYLNMVSVLIYIINTGSDNLTHTSNHPIFKISFDSENVGKSLRYSLAISLAL